MSLRQEQPPSLISCLLGGSLAHDSREDILEAMVAIGFQLSNGSVYIALAANASVFIELCNEVTDPARRQQPCFGGEGGSLMVHGS